MLLFSCGVKKQEADLIVHHAVVYTVDSTFSVQQALVVKDGKILFAGNDQEALSNYTAKEIKDASGKVIFPGFIDAHCHFYGYGKGLNEIDLVGTTSFSEVIAKTVSFVKEHDLSREIDKPVERTEMPGWIIGRGWDQNDWPVKEYPTREQLDSLFPWTPVLLKRIDGHAVLVNGTALQLAGFAEKTKISGGELIVKNGKLTGVLVDNAADSLEKIISKPGKEAIKKALLKAQENCLAMGLTTIDDAGIEKSVVDAIDELQKDGKLKMRVYAMLTPNNENLDHYLKNGRYKTDRLNVRSFKFYGDGALGSRGACLLQDYSDKKGWKGFLLNEPSYYSKFAGLMLKHGFQMNTHCIGDSAARLILQIINAVSKSDTLRWRMEHAQVINKNDVALFKKLKVIPSVQPTHATSDMYWAGERLGNERIKQAYAYKELLQAVGCLPLGTDFPVEDISPFKTFYAAVVRKDAKGFPAAGFQKENALTREETVKGMTIWAAYSNFEEKEKGSLEPGKWADFIILDTDLMKCAENKILDGKVLSTYIAGEEVYKR